MSGAGYYDDAILANRRCLLSDDEASVERLARAYCQSQGKGHPAEPCDFGREVARKQIAALRRDVTPVELFHWLALRDAYEASQHYPALIWTAEGAVELTISELDLFVERVWYEHG